MTREELREHCLIRIEGCEMLARHNGEEPHGKVYEEHKLILELLEQEPIIDKIRAEIKALSPEPTAYDVVDGNPIKDAVWEIIADVLKIIDKYKAEIETNGKVSVTREEIIDFCNMKAHLEPENEDIFMAIIKALEQKSKIKVLDYDEAARKL